MTRQLGCLSLFALVSLASLATAQIPGQPWASHFYPNTIRGSNPRVQSLKTWTPASDPDSAYNRSHVPLATRFMTRNVNPNARADGAGVVSLVAFDSTSANPAQGSPTMTKYQPTYWQYHNVFSAFGGSAGEGIILTPLPGIVDAGHRNGVPVLGNIFFPPTAYGGEISMVNELLEKTGSTFPVGDKLVEVALHYGFDGWFFNQETAGGNSATATTMREFIAHCRAKAPSLHFQWYDAMTESGSISWQNALNSSNDAYLGSSAAPVSHSMFLNFWWSDMSSSRTTANNLGRSPYDIYAGIDVEGGGYNTTVQWGGLFPAGATQKVSVGFYRPEWTFNQANGSGGSDLVKTKAFFVNDSKFWVGANRDPSNTSGYVAGGGTTGWKGLANYIVARSPVQSYPFVTHFSTGQGQFYAINGIQLKTGNWSNASLQDVLPTWRWILTSTGSKLTPDISWDDAYYGGSCLSITGDVAAVNHLDLYEVRLPVSATTTSRIIYKTGTATAPSRMSLALSFTTAPTTFVTFPLGNTTSSGWNTANVDLSAHAGKTIQTIALECGDGTAITGYSMKVGELAFFNAPISTPAAPTAAIFDGSYIVDADTASARLRWTHSTDQIYQYNVYRTESNGTRRWLGATANNAYFIQAIDQPNPARIEIEAIGLDFGVSSVASITLPTIGAVADVTINEDGSSSALAIPITGTTGLTLSASSTNTTLFPNSAFSFAGTGNNRKLVITPARSEIGDGQITITATDQGYSVQRTILARVAAVPGPKSTSLSIASTFDDAEESATGTTSVNSSDLELVNDGAAGDQKVGLRFNPLRIPQGSIITRATIHFSADEVQTETTLLTLRAELADSAQPFVQAANNISSRVLTSLSVPWQPPAWNVVGQAAEPQQTPNLAGLLQEVINRPGWTSGSAVVFVISGTGHRTADAFDKSGSIPARLEIEYITAPRYVFTSSTITASSDDAEQASGGSVSLTSTDLELVNDGAAGNQTVGLRFTSIGIPKGAVIGSAAVQFSADEVNTEATALTIKAEASDNAATFTTTSNSLTSRTKGTASVSWNPIEWNAVGETAAAQKTPDLTSLIQPVINRSGWAAGRALALYFTGIGHRTADAFDDSEAIPAVLTISYTTDPEVPRFPEWAQLKSLTGLNAQPLANPDADSLANIVEYALGLDPQKPDDRPLTLARGTSSLEVIYHRSSLTPEITTQVEWSPDLTSTSWNTSGVTQEIIADDGTLRTIRATVNDATSERKFVRLRVGQ